MSMLQRGADDASTSSKSSVVTVQGAHREPLLDETAPPTAAAKPSLARHLWLSRAAMFCYFFGFFLQRMCTAEYVLLQSCAQHFNVTACIAHPHLNKDVAVERSSALCATWTTVSMFVLALFSTSWLSAASDVCGRKPVLLASVGSMCVGCASMTAVAHAGASSWWLILPSLVSGAGGSFGAFVAAIFASTADVSTSAAMRSRAFSRLEGCVFLAGIIAPESGGLIMRRLTSTSATAGFALATALFAASVGFTCALRETVASASVRRARALPFCTTACAPLQLLHSDGSGGSSGGGSGGSSVGYVCLVFLVAFLPITGYAAPMLRLATPLIPPRHTFPWPLIPPHLASLP